MVIFLIVCAYMCGQVFMPMHMYEGQAPLDGLYCPWFILLRERESVPVPVSQRVLSTLTTSKPQQANLHCQPPATLELHVPETMIDFLHGC